MAPETNKVGSAPKPGRNPWLLSAWISGVFALLLSLGMVAGHLRARAQDPLGSPKLKELKAQLRENPTDEKLKQEIRALDLQLRQTYFTNVSGMRSGVYMLLSALAVFLVSIAQVRARRAQLPILKAGGAGGGSPRALAYPGQAGASRWAVVTAGTVAAGLLVLIGFGPSVRIDAASSNTGTNTQPDQAAASGPDAAPLAELQRHWPRFLGLNGGATEHSNAPVELDIPKGVGVLWKVASPAQGFNSPIIWSNRIFFSGGDAEKLEVFSLDADAGKIVWRQQVANIPGSPKGKLEIPESTGLTAPTMTTDGRRVYAMFANGDLAAFTLEGKPVWTKAFGELKNPYGHATSLIAWEDRLIVQLDQGDAEEGKSRIYALDGRTGQPVWQKARKVGGSWATPVAFEAAGKGQIVALALPHVISYSVKDGAELWRADCLNGEICPSPVFASGVVFVVSPSDRLMGIRPDGSGDVTKTHLAWQADENVPDVTSPVSNGELVFTVSTSGIVSCYNAKDGKKQWEHELDMDVHASPGIAGGRVHILSQKGTVVLIDAARQYKEILRSETGDSFHASPAFTANGNMVARGVSNIWCFGASPGQPRQKP